MLQQPTRSTLVPYTTLFRSCRQMAIRTAAQFRGRSSTARYDEGNPWPRKQWRQALRPVTFSPGNSRVPHCEVRREDTEFLPARSEEHTSELQSLRHLVCRLL